MPPLDQQTDVTEEVMQQSSEMPFVEHLEQLRWHIMRSVAAVLVFSTAAFVMKGLVFDELIFGPTRDSFITYRAMCKLSILAGLGDTLCMSIAKFEIINTEMSGQFLMHLQASAIIGFAIAFPYVFWEFWQFVKPGLQMREIRSTRGILFFTSTLFIAGVLFGYYILTPFAFNFFVSYNVSESVPNYFTLSNYVSFITMFVLLSGIVFELPMVVYFLSKLGLVTPGMMREYRRHAVVGILLIAAIITPPDVGSQLLIFVPIYVLYELSIFVSARVVRDME